MKHRMFKISGVLIATIGLVIGVYLVQRIVNFFSDAGGVNANLVVDLSTNYDNVKDSWQNLAQGGESKDRMLAPIISEVRNLKPKYIRIDHVFDYYSNPTDLDGYIQDIVATGAKPFIALSYMPTTLSRSGNVDDIPRNWLEWEDKVQKLAEHISSSSGLGISDVYYEVWNEPDLFGGFKLYGDKSYLELYSHTVRALMRSRNMKSYKVGGPATTAFYPNWINGLLDYTIKNNLRLDFLSWHKYSKNLGEFEADANNMREILVKRNLPNIESMITEMGTTGANDATYDNSFGAIHEIAVNTALFGIIDRVFTFEIIDGAGSEKYWGRWGIYTNEKFGAPEAKPRAKALTFLNNMAGGERRNVSGQGSWVKSFAKKYDNNTKVLVVNYDPISAHSEAVPFTLTNLSFPNFTFKRTDFLGSTTSIDVATSSATWSTSVYLKPNSAAIFEVIPK